MIAIVIAGQVMAATTIDDLTTTRRGAVSPECRGETLAMATGQARERMNVSHVASSTPNHSVETSHEQVVCREIFRDELLMAMRVPVVEFEAVQFLTTVRLELRIELPVFRWMKI